MIANARMYSVTPAAAVAWRALLGRVVEVVLAGEADVGPVDAYALSLLREHEPALVAPLRTIARTPPTALPLFVASPGVAKQQLTALRAALLDLAHCAEAASDLQCL